MPGTSSGSHHGFSWGKVLAIVVAASIIGLGGWAMATEARVTVLENTLPPMAKDIREIRKVLVELLREQPWRER